MDQQKQLSVFLPSQSRVSQSGSQSETVPLGRPIANTQVFTFSTIHLQLLPGVPGELHIGGGILTARGYPKPAEADNSSSQLL